MYILSWIILSKHLAEMMVVLTYTDKLGTQSNKMKLFYPYILYFNIYAIGVYKIVFYNNLMSCYSNSFSIGSFFLF